MIEGSSPDRGWEFFSSPPRLDRLWDPSNLLSSRYRGGGGGSLLCDKAAGA